MRTTVPERIHKVIADIEAHGNVPLTRLNILEKWFEHPGRLSAFGLWIARRAAGRKGKTKGEYEALLKTVKPLLGPASTRDSIFARPDRQALESFHTRAASTQNEFEIQKSSSVRIVRCRPLWLVEQGVAIYLWHANSPSHGYKLAADWAENYDPRYGHGLNGPSCGKLDELIRFMFVVEALEGE